jgi:putative aminopeptidase FrvX
MTSTQLQLLKQITETPGAPGFEEPIRNLVIEQVQDLVDKYRIDPLGNVIAFRKGSDDRSLMVSAHMDEIGFMVSFIEDEGFIRFHTLGGFDPKTLTSQRVTVHGKKDILGVMGSKPIHMMTEEDRSKAPEIKDYYVDTGMSKEDLEQWVEVGNPITRAQQFAEMGDCVNAKSLDNRLSVFILIETLRKIKAQKLPHDLYAVFSVQEEVGLRGAMTAAHQINPAYGLALDVTIAYDVPGAKPHEEVTQLGRGTAIKIMDSSTICDVRMVRYLKRIANEHKIPWQAEVLPRGGTDTAGLQRSGKDGSIAGAISIPLRHLHQVIEMAHKSDIQNSISLLEAAILNLSKFEKTNT